MKNGPLRFVSMADRALDVCQFEYRGENLVLRRTITSVYGRLSITVEDEVTNESFRDDQSPKACTCTSSPPTRTAAASPP